MTDWAGMAILVGAVGLFIVQVGTFIRAGRTDKTVTANAARLAAVDNKADEIRTATNGAATELRKMLDAALLELAQTRLATMKTAIEVREERKILTDIALDAARAAEPVPPFDEGAVP